MSCEPALNELRVPIAAAVVPLLAAALTALAGLGVVVAVVLTARQMARVGRDDDVELGAVADLATEGVEARHRRDAERRGDRCYVGCLAPGAGP